MTDTNEDFDKPPRYVHDCSACRYLGRMDDADLYVCAKEPTVIARHGAEGSYYSGLSFSYGQHLQLTEARLRAQRNGLLKFNLREAVHYTPHDAKDEHLAELKAALQASDEGKAMALLATDVTEGARQLTRFIENGASSLKERFPDRELEDLRGWERQYLLDVYQWMVRLDMPRCEPTIAMGALYVMTVTLPDPPESGTRH